MCHMTLLNFSTRAEKIQDIDIFEKNDQGEKNSVIKPPLTNLNISKSVERFVIKLFFDIVIKILEIFDVVHLIFIIFRSAFPFLR